MSRFFKTVVASFVRPANATAYAQADLVANNTVAGDVEPLEFQAARYLGGNGLVRGVRIDKSSVGVENASFRVHLFKDAPTVTGGDNAALATSDGRAKGYFGSVDVTVDKAQGDGASGRADCDIVFDCDDAKQKIYALVEARGAYVPANGETIAVALELERN